MMKDCNWVGKVLGVGKRVWVIFFIKGVGVDWKGGIFYVKI